MPFKKLILLFIISAFAVFHSSAQGGLISSNYNMIGMKRIYTNLQGSISPIDVNLSKTNKSALLSYRSNYTFGVSFETLNHFKRNDKWTYTGEVGLYYAGGALDYKALIDSYLLIGNERYQREIRRQTQFKSLYLFTGAKVGYNLVPKHNLIFAFGPKLAGRIKNKATVNTNSFLHELEFDTNFAAYNNNFNSDSDDDLIPLQVFFSFGIFKRFSFIKNKIFIGLEYDRSLLNIHNKGNIKSHMISVSIKYAWAKKKPETSKN